MNEIIIEHDNIIGDPIVTGRIKEKIDIDIVFDFIEALNTAGKSEIDSFLSTFSCDFLIKNNRLIIRFNSSDIVVSGDDDFYAEFDLMEELKLEIDSILDYAAVNFLKPDYDFAIKHIVSMRDALSKAFNRLEAIEKKIHDKWNESQGEGEV